MKRLSSLLVFLGVFAGISAAQSDVTRHKFEFDAAGVFPVGGYKANNYSPGPALRAGYEFRLQRYLAADLGWTSAWLPGASCSRVGCYYPRNQNRLLDYGVRGVLPLANGRVDVSVGVGGGYIWFDPSYGDPEFYNGSLIQYSGKASVAVDRDKHFRVEFSVRAWRDLGRPIQQWLSTAAGISYGFGSVK